MLPDAFVAEQNRMRSTRATASRGLTQRRWRRRVLPPLAVTSAVLLGTGTAGAWVNAELTVKSAPPAATDASSQLAALEKLRQQLSADQQTLAAMAVAVLSAQPQAGPTLATAATTTAPAPAPGQPAQPAQPSSAPQLGKPKAGTATQKSTTAPRVAGPAAVAPKASSAAANPAPVAQPTVAAPAPVRAPVVAPPTQQAPAPAPPPTHATTGASGAKP